jgi:transcriptional antiterminator RfaH
MTNESVWLLVATKARAEAVAAEHLARQGFGVCAPQLRVKKRRRGQWQWVVEPLFPGYVFVQLTLGEQDIAPIRSTVGCRGLVRFGGTPQPVPEVIISPLLAMNDQPVALDSALKAGDRVRIEEGAFAGLEAVFTLPKGEDRVQVLIDILGGTQRIVLDKEAISRVDPSG